MTMQQSQEQSVKLIPFHCRKYKGVTKIPMFSQNISSYKSIKGQKAIEKFELSGKLKYAKLN